MKRKLAYQVSCAIAALWALPHAASAAGIATVVLGVSTGYPTPISAQTFAETAKLIGGAAVGLAVHESAHVVADFASGVTPGVKKVTFGPIPFFAITHDPVTPTREFVISSAGFWAQEALTEYLLVAHPELRSEDAPFSAPAAPPAWRTCSM